MESKEFIEIRKALGLSQVDLANEFGISSKQISNFETGKSDIKQIYADRMIAMRANMAAIKSTLIPNADAYSPDNLIIVTPEEHDFLQLFKDYAPAKYLDKVKKELEDFKKQIHGSN